MCFFFVLTQTYLWTILLKILFNGRPGKVKGGRGRQQEVRGVIGGTMHKNDFKKDSPVLFLFIFYFNTEIYCLPGTYQIRPMS